MDLALAQIAERRAALEAKKAAAEAPKGSAGMLRRAEDGVLMLEVSLLWCWLRLCASLHVLATTRRLLLVIEAATIECFFMSAVATRALLHFPRSLPADITGRQAAWPAANS